jgi:hypothetical protein
MNSLPKGPQAARLRQRKFELIARFDIPADLLPGSVSVSHLGVATLERRLAACGMSELG